ncbi:MAG: hypothetical protein CME62_02515 [Halobacteriovoraceae bacterium]|nr:hypothetical protein [Halobacteriovoraceae bacterium]|tara:strand:+ start:10823 stop:13171 length:2349 start_codon:yes stop_codon:yes gene_type:complete
MKDSFYYFLYRLGQTKPFFHLSYKYYELGITFLTFVLSKYRFVESVYLKGSYGKDYFIPFVSDLDFFIVGETSFKNKARLKKIFKFFNIFFPMIKEYDFHNDKEALVLTRFGGVKIFDFSNWYLLFGKAIEFNYIYHPEKYHLDLVHEIFFQFQWLFENLKKRKKGYRYRSLVVKRQFNKITDYINLMYTTENKKPQKNDLKEDLYWRELTNEEIIQRFNQLVQCNESLNKLAERFHAQLDDLDLDKILELPYFKSHLKLIGQDFEYAGHDYYLTQKNFKLFYSTGALDTYILFKLIEKQREDNLKNLFLKYYCARLLEGRVNDHHNISYAKNIIAKEELNSLDRFELQTSDRTFNFIQTDLMVMILFEGENSTFSDAIKTLRAIETEREKVLFHIRCRENAEEYHIEKNDGFHEICIALDERDYLLQTAQPIKLWEVAVFFDGASSIQFVDTRGSLLTQDKPYYTLNNFISPYKYTLLKYLYPLINAERNFTWYGIHIFNKNEFIDRIEYILLDQELDFYSLKYQLDILAHNKNEKKDFCLTWPFASKMVSILPQENTDYFLVESLSHHKIKFNSTLRNYSDDSFPLALKMKLGEKSPFALRMLALKIVKNSELETEEIQVEKHHQVSQKLEGVNTYYEDNAFYHMIYFYDSFDRREIDVCLNMIAKENEIYELDVLDIPDLNDIKFSDFYLKSQSLNFQGESFHKGLYKFIIYFDQVISGPLVLTSTNKRLYEKQFVSKQSEVAFFSYLPFDEFKLAIIGDSSFLSHIIEIDCLKADLLF